MLALGIYEKALPKETSWLTKLKMAKSLGFQFVELSIDETDERLARLEWSPDQIANVRQAISETGVGIYSICLSGHRRYPLGSADKAQREKALVIMQQAIDLASQLGVRTIQLAGYDVYYETKTVASREYFVENLRKSVEMAAKKQVMLAIEIMDDPFMNSITKFNRIKAEIPSPWLQVYPDIGNLSAWPMNDVSYELTQGIAAMTSVHLKDTIDVSTDFPGKFKNVPFGEGNVDFLGSLKALKRLNYCGTFLIEMWSETSEHPIEEIKKAREFLIPIFEEAGYETRSINHC